jgi:hypothetical protein
MLLFFNIFILGGDHFSRKLPSFNPKWACDTPSSSLMDSTSSPKVKTMKREGVGACSLVRNTSWVEGHVGAPIWDSED